MRALFARQKKGRAVKMITMPVHCLLLPTNQCAGFEDPEASNQNIDVGKNERGIHDMARLPGQPFPAASKMGGAVEAHIRGVVVPGDLIDDGER